MNSDCDVVVIGGGMAGAGVAAALSTDRRVILLEKEDQPGAHATGRSAAMHSEIYGNAAVRALSRASRSFFLSDMGDLPFVTQRGFVHVATEGQVDLLNSFGSSPDVAGAVDRLTGAEARALVPILRVDGIVAALAERHAYELDVNAIHRFFLRQLRRHGGALHCGSEVSRCGHDGQVWTVVAGDRQVRAPVLVNAAGAWGDVVAQMAGVAPIGLVPKRRTALIVDAPAGVDPAPWPMVMDIGEQFYFKPDAGKLLLSPADETPDEPCDAWAEELDLATAVDRVQQIADLPVDRINHSWAGLRTFAPDKSPVVGFDARAPGFFWLVGQGGYGIQTAPALSRLAAALVRQEPVPDDLTLEGVRAPDLAPDRFTATPASLAA